MHLPNAKGFGKGALPVEGRLAQLVEHLVYTERVSGSSPLAPTIFGIAATQLKNLGKAISFILQKAFLMQFGRMRGILMTFGTGLVVFGAAMMPEAAFAREVEQAEIANCTDPKHRHAVVRPLTESAPIRKTEKLRIRRILM